MKTRDEILEKIKNIYDYGTVQFKFKVPYKRARLHSFSSQTNLTAIITALRWVIEMDKKDLVEQMIQEGKLPIQK